VERVIMCDTTPLPASLDPTDETLVEALFTGREAFVAALCERGMTAGDAGAWLARPDIEATVERVRRMRRLQAELDWEQAQLRALEAIGRTLEAASPADAGTILRAVKQLLQLTSEPHRRRPRRRHAGTPAGHRGTRCEGAAAEKQRSRAKATVQFVLPQTDKEGMVRGGADLVPPGGSSLEAPASSAQRGGPQARGAAMDMLVHCAGCRQPLRVPANAAGHRARCPACKTTFVVPAAEELFEETVSTWIEQDLEAIHHLEELGAKITPTTDSGDTVYAASVDPRSPTPKTPDLPEAPAPVEPSTASQPGTIIRQYSKRVYWGRKQAPKSSAGQPGGDIASPPRVVPRPAEKPLPVERLSVPPVRTASDSGAVSLPASVDSPAMSKSGSGPPLTYPTNLQRDPVAPHLVITRTSHAGITLAFDAVWLHHEAFRGAIPVRCAFCGRNKRDELIARPLVFDDRALTDKATLEQAVAVLEHRHIGDRSARHLAEHMMQVPHMPPPFYLPMPYFVSTRYAHLSVHCVTRNRSDGGVTCEVLIPDPHTALAWVCNVNGMCGPEYELLEREVSLLHGEAWRALSETCRDRISYWCKLHPGEQFRLFISDADFGKRDEGMGGLVVTDQRIVFCKYHHRGQVRLDDDSMLRIKINGGFASLTLVSGSDRLRMVKICESEVARLQEVIAHAPGLRYELVQDEPQADSATATPAPG
jgi:LSD1 subclass zinc finger protein